MVTLELVNRISTYIISAVEDGELEGSKEES